MGPAIAGGNAVPQARQRYAALGPEPVELLLEAGLPRKPSLVSPARRRIGRGDRADARVRKISFTGSAGWVRPPRARPVSRVIMELGSNSPVIVLDDADGQRSPRRWL